MKQRSRVGKVERYIARKMEDRKMERESGRPIER